MRTVKSSKRPMSIKKAQNHFALIVKCAKLSTGLTLPMAGPIFPKLEAAAPNAETKSNPNKFKVTEAIIKINM